MADIIRTQFSLLTALFQDGQANGSITAQDIRDLIVSLSVAHGGMYISTAIATTINASSTYVKAAGNTTLLTMSRGVTMSADNRLTYTESADRNFQVIITCSSTVTGNNQMVGFQIAKNGFLISNTIVLRKFSQGSDTGSISLSTLITLSTNDFLELFVANNTSINDIKIEDMTFNIVGNI